METFLVNYVEDLIRTHVTDSDSIGKISHTTVNVANDYDTQETAGAIGVTTLTLVTSYVLNTLDYNIDSFKEEFNKARQNITYSDNTANGRIIAYTNSFQKGVGNTITTTYTYEMFA